MEKMENKNMGKCKEKKKIWKIDFEKTKIKNRKRKKLIKKREEELKEDIFLFRIYATQQKNERFIIPKIVL